MAHRRVRTSILAVLALCGFAHAAAADVLVVDPSGAGDFTEIQPAVDASQDGDIVLVHPGSYQAVVLATDSLALIARFPGTVTIDWLQIRDLPSGRWIAISGLETLVDCLAVSPTRTWSDSEGSIRVQDCTIRVKPGLHDSDWLLRCSDVAFTDCELIGLDGYDGTPPGEDGHPGAAGLWAVDSQVALFDSTLRGGDGGHGEAGIAIEFYGGDGGPGCWLNQSLLFAMNTYFEGGDGGEGATNNLGGNGGDGVYFDSNPPPLSQAYLR